MKYSNKLRHFLNSGRNDSVPRPYLRTIDFDQIPFVGIVKGIDILSARMGKWGKGEKGENLPQHKYYY
jgi:hypothetical protein